MERNTLSIIGHYGPCSLIAIWGAHSVSVLHSNYIGNLRLKLLYTKPITVIQLTRRSCLLASRGLLVGTARCKGWGVLDACYFQNYFAN